MKKLLKTVAALTVAVIMLSSVPMISAGGNDSASPALEYYVSTDGSDENSGKKDAPFATIEAARDAIRELKATSGLPNGGITVHIAEGTYYLEHTVSLTEEDSGTADCPITYVGDGNVLFSGGYFMDPSDFSPVTDEAIRSRLDYPDAVLEYDLSILSDAGIDWGENYQYYMSARDYKYEHEFYVNGSNYCLARYPNKDDGFLFITESVPDEKSDQIFVITDQENKLEKTLTWDWDNQFILMAGYMCECYLYMESPAWSVEKHDDGKTWATVQKEDGNPGKTVHSLGMRFFLHNALEALDVEGEYYIDKSARKLYMILPEDYMTSDIVIPYFSDEFMFTVCTNYVTFDNIDVVYTQGNAMYLSGDHVNILNSEISCTFQHGLRCEGGLTNALIDGNYMHDLGAQAIEFRHIGNFADMTPGSLIISNNEFTKWGQRDTWCNPAVSVDESCGAVIRNNYFHDSATGAIAWGETDILIEYNICHDVNIEMKDDAAIHAGGNRAQDGVIIRYNYIYNCYGNGIYFDAAQSYAEAYGNILVNIGDGYAYWVQGSAINLPMRGGYIKNNIIVNPYQQSVACYGLGNDIGSDISPLYTHNAYDPLQRLRSTDLLLINPTIGAKQCGFVGDYIGSAGYITVMNNVSYSTNKNRYHIDYETETKHPDEFELSDSVSMKNLTYYTNPGFVDIMGDLSDIQNANLRDDSEVYSILPGFERIPIEKIGIGNYDK